MKKYLPLVLVAACIGLPATAQTVAIDYAADFDFGQVKTFQYVETEESNLGDSLMDQRIKSAIIERLTATGLQQVDSEPDLYITYHVATEKNTSFQTTGSFGYGGWGPGWRRWGVSVGTATTTATTFTEGTLIIDAYEPGEKRMVWRGTGTVTVKSKPEKRMQQIDRILDKLGKRWKKILAKQGK